MRKLIVFTGAATALFLSFMASLRLKSRRDSGFTESEGYVVMPDEPGVDLVDEDAAVRGGFVGGKDTRTASGNGGVSGGFTR